MAFEGLSTWALHIIHHQIDADLVTTRYFPLARSWNHYPHKHLTQSGEYMIAAEEVGSTSCRLVSRKLSKNDHIEESSGLARQAQDDLPVYLENLNCYPSSLADSRRFLLLGQNDDEIMRLLIAPLKGHALIIKALSLTFNEAKRRLEAEWGKRQAFRDKGIEETGEQNTVMEGNRREKNEQRDERAGSASH